MKNLILGIIIGIALIIGTKTVLADQRFWVTNVYSAIDNFSVIDDTQNHVSCYLADRNTASLECIKIK